MTIIRTLLLASLFASTLAIAAIPHEAELRAQTTKLIDAMAERNADAVSAMVSKNGISVGVGAETMKPGKFSRELHKRSGIYCALMDSHCIENRGRDSALIDTFRYKTPLKVVTEDGDTNKAVVTTVYQTHETELHFIYEDGSWKLTHVEWN